MSSMRFSDGTVIKSEAFIMNCMVTTTPLERLEWLKNLQTEVDSHNCNCEYCDYAYEYNFVNREIKVIEQWLNK